MGQSTCASSPGTTPGTTRCGQRPEGTDEANDRFDGPAWSAPTQWFQTDHEPDREGSLEQRLQRLQTRIMEGDKQGAYKVALGLRGAREARPQGLESQLLFCAIIDLQDTLQQRKLQNIRHKALRARALVSLARLVGWEQARPLLYCVVPDMLLPPPVSPVRPLHAGAGGRFKNDCTPSRRNRSAMSPLSGRPCRDDSERDGGGITRHLTELLGAGKRLIAISDTVIARLLPPHQPGGLVAAQLLPDRARLRLHQRGQLLAAQLRPPHQAKAVYFQAHFVHDCIRLTKTPRNPERDYLGDPATFRGWADGLSTGILLQQLLGAIEGLDCARAALTEAT